MSLERGSCSLGLVAVSVDVEVRWGALSVGC